tara:strand:+ start:569 stop:1702 length:1134 start_codon:yes stop_codon:yes gene_type:complete
MILGADGYLGWPTSVELALKNHNLLLIDNFIKRKLIKKYNRKVLVNTARADKQLTKLKKYNKKIEFANIDCTNYVNLSSKFKNFKPDAVIHFAEMPSAPLSMLGDNEGWMTLKNNLQSTYNLISIIKKYNANCHIIKLGTMGEYGTPNIDIEEGWLNINHKKRTHKFLYPRQASSLYHTSKIMDTDLLWFYVRMSNLRVTDLMQGPVYGVNSSKIMKDACLQPLFTYDDIFGTVLNRFIVQGITNNPLTIYGSGSQIRGYINIKDTIKCIMLSLKNPPKAGNLEIYNQFTEQFSINELANRVITALSKIGLDTTICKIKNPRIEKEKHYYNAKNSKLKKLGLKPTLLTENSIIEIANYVKKYKKNIDKSLFQPRIKW